MLTPQTLLNIEECATWQKNREIDQAEANCKPVEHVDQLQLGIQSARRWEKLDDPASPSSAYWRGSRFAPLAVQETDAADDYGPDLNILREVLFDGKRPRTCLEAFAELTKVPYQAGLGRKVRERFEKLAKYRSRAFYTDASS